MILQTTESENIIPDILKSPIDAHEDVSSDVDSAIF
jgi:hypothetical protein